jgi:hypothetical protein
MGVQISLVVRFFGAICLLAVGDYFLLAEGLKPSYSVKHPLQAAKIVVQDNLFAHNSGGFLFGF